MMNGGLVFYFDSSAQRIPQLFIIHFSFFIIHLLCSIFLRFAR